jgi:hypothetical protein
MSDDVTAPQGRLHLSGEDGEGRRREQPHLGTGRGVIQAPLSILHMENHE